ncbi:MAG: S-layer homology domain-containing protein [Clostridia bacterium]|nr:S-layer homology domain-containing protein [Clostridia bacterium]
MSKVRKITSFIVAAVMTAGMSLTSFAALPGDAVGSAYEEAIETLGALEIMVGDEESGNFRPEAPIKRSEFAKVAVEAMGLGAVAESSTQKTKYPDVVENHWANGYINVATQQGVVIGDDQQNFRPDDSITYAEAMTILVRIIGHEPSAEAKGGFPSGYLVVGSQNGINKNATANANEAVVRGMVAQMTFNALTVKLMEQVGFGNDVKYEVVDKTLLEDTLDTQKVYAQITAVGTSSINGTSSLKDNEVRLGEKVYEVSDKALNDVRNLLGFNVVGYVKEFDNGDEKLILARAEKSKNHSVKISTDDIESVTSTETMHTLDYWLDKDKDSDTQQIDIAIDAKMIYNGKAVDFDAALIKPEAGRIVALDHNNDDIYDIVFVTSTENYVVEEVVTSSNRITDKYGKPSLVLDPKNEEIKFVISRGGQLLSVSDLEEWDVLSVAKSKDGKIINIEVSSESVTGKVAEKDGDKIFINGEEYKVAKNYTETINLNDEGTFYLDVEGKIAAVDATATLSSNYAYLTAAGMKSGFDKVLEVKLFTKEGETKVLTSTEKIKLNGKSGKLAEEALNALKDGDGNVAAQLVTFELNKDGEISQLNTAVDKTESGEINKNVFTKNVQASLKYKEASKKLGEYNIDANTIVFDIPEGKTHTTDFAIGNIDLFEDGTEYNVSIYDIGEDMTAKVIIVTNSQGVANLEAPLAVIDQITTVNNDDNENVQKVYAYVNGERVSYVTAEDGILVNGEDAALKRGDIVQFKLNSKNEVENIRVLFEVANKGTEAETQVAEDLLTVYGRVVKKFANSINVQVGEGKVKNYSISDAKVYEVDTAKTNNAIKVVTPGDIAQYDELDQSRVFIKIYKDAVQEIVIVK